MSQDQREGDSECSTGSLTSTVLSLMGEQLQLHGQVRTKRNRKVWLPPKRVAPSEHEGISAGLLPVASTVELEPKRGYWRKLPQWWHPEWAGHGVSEAIYGHQKWHHYYQQAAATPPMGIPGSAWCFPWIPCPSCYFQHQHLQKMSPLRAIWNMKAAKMTTSPEKFPETPRLLKRYLGRGGINLLSRMDGNKTIWRP